MSLEIELSVTSMCSFVVSIQIINILDAIGNKLTMFIHKYFVFKDIKVIALQKPEMCSTFFWECFENGCGNIHPITFTVSK